MFDKEILLSDGITSPESANFRFDKKMVQVECDTTTKIRRRSRGERSTNPALRSHKASVQELSKTAAVHIKIADQAPQPPALHQSTKRLSTVKKSRSPACFKPVLNTTAKKNTLSPSVSVASSSFHKSPNPMKQLTSAISQLQSKKKVKSPRKQK